jgi:hypothetical protein
LLRWQSQRASKTAVKNPNSDHHFVRDTAAGAMLSSKAGLKLSGEYECMKRSFDGIHVDYLVPIKKNAPEDYKRILEWFPFIEAEAWRHERAGLV